MGLDWNRITRLHSQVMTGTHELTNSIKHIKMQPTNLQSEYIKDEIKQQTRDKLNVWRIRKKSEPQMGFEPTTLRHLVRCSNHWATGVLYGEQGIKEMI